MINFQYKCLRSPLISSLHTKRIQILNQSEINELYALPNFNRTDRDDYFSLDNETKALIVRYVKSSELTPTNNDSWLIAFGYKIFQ